MNDKIKECLFSCEKLIELLEEEIRDINNCFTGDIQEDYVKTIKNEINKLKETRRNLQRML